MRTLDGLPGESPRLQAAAAQVESPASPTPPGSLLRVYLELLSGAPLPEWDLVERQVRTLRFRPRTVLFDYDVRHPYLYVIRRGTLRVEALAPDGRPHVIAFCRPPDVVASVQALAPEGLRRLLTQSSDSPKRRAALGTGRTNSRAVAVTSCEVERVDFRVLERAMSRHSEWAGALFAVMTLHALVKERRERELLMFTPEERYRRFLEDYPDLVEIVPQKEIASYIGVTAVGLSRIAARVRRAREAGAAAASPHPAGDAE